MSEIRDHRACGSGGPGRDEHPAAISASCSMPGDNMEAVARQPNGQRGTIVIATDSLRTGEAWPTRSLMPPHTTMPAPLHSTSAAETTPARSVAMP